MTLGVYLAIGESMGDFKKKGQDTLIVNQLLKNYSDNFEKVYVFSYANESMTFFKNVIVVANKWQLHRYIYAPLLPLLNLRYIRRCDVFRGLQLTGGIPAVVSKLLFKKPFIFNFGYDYARFAQIEGKWTRSFLYKLIALLTSLIADKIIVTAEYLKSFIKSTYKHKVSVVPNGVDTELFRPPTRKRRKNQILYVGRLERQKNLLNLIQALGLIKQLKLELLLIGEGSQKQQFMQKAKKRGVKLKLLSPVAHDHLPQIMNRARLFVLPSLAEGQPKVLLEAMSCSLPLVASDILAHREIITHGENGLLCGFDPESIARAIETIIADKDLERRLIKNSRNSVLVRFSMETRNKLEIDVIKEAVLN